MTVERKQLKETTTIAIRRDWLEQDYNSLRDKPDLFENNPTIEARWLIVKELLEKGTVTLSAKKDNDGTVTVILDSSPVKLSGEPLNEFSFEFVISCLFPLCQMERGGGLSKDILKGQPLKIEIQENPSSEPVIRKPLD